MIPQLPDDLLIEILAKLPVRTLLKLRCVCKSWLSLISSQQFVKTHLAHTKKDTNLRIILRCNGYVKQCSVPHLLYEPITDVSSYTQFPVNISTNWCQFVGSCDGLICLAVDDRDLILWNPSTRVHKTLPNSDFGVEINRRSVYGFGFDKSSDDYKVVVVFHCGGQPYNHLSKVRVKVYSLKSNQWKTIGGFKGRCLMDDSCAFAHGKLHWVASSECKWNILYLNLETEAYGMIKFPNYAQYDCSYSRLGAAVEGRLVLLCGYENKVDVWIHMGDYDGLRNGIWTKLVTIPDLDVFFVKFTSRTVLCVLKNGDVVMLCGSRIVILDAKNGTYRHPNIRYSNIIMAASTYFESLVSPLG